MTQDFWESLYQFVSVLTYLFYSFIYLFIHYYATEAAHITLQTYENKTHSINIRVVS